MGQSDDNGPDLTTTQALDPEQAEAAAREALEAKAKRIEEAMGHGDAEGTVRMSLDDQVEARQAAAVPFSGEAPPPSSITDDVPAWKRGATLATDGAPPMSTPFVKRPRQEAAPAAPRAAPVPVPPVRVTEPSWTDGLAGLAATPKPELAPEPPAREVVEVPLAVPRTPAPRREPAPASGASTVHVWPDPLDDPETYSTPETRKAARDLTALMTTENADLTRFRRRHMKGAEPLAHGDVARMRDILRALAHAMSSPDDDTGDRLREAWRLLFDEPRAIRKRRGPRDSD